VRYGDNMPEIRDWLRSGNTGAGQGAAQFLSEALGLLGNAYQVRCVRADSGFYADNFLSFLEECALPYIVGRALRLISKAGFINLSSGKPLIQSTQ
jgi:hypothetical protein